MKYEDVYKYSHNLNILYIEDDDSMRKETADIFKSLFSFTETAKDGVEGLQKYRKNYEYFDLIIMDINMPRKNGLELIVEILQLNIKQEIIVISAHNEADRLLELINLGISDFIVKPFLQDTLYTVMYKVSKKISMHKRNMISSIHKEKTIANSELLKNISHQWKQPLSLITTILSTLIMKHETNITIDDEKLLLEKALRASEQLVNIISDFECKQKSFNIENKKTFFIKEVFREIQILLDKEICNSNINLQFNINENVLLNDFYKELIEVNYLIINNAIEALIKSDIPEKYIFINSWVNESKIYIQIEDNGGGIKPKELSKIFDPYFTTKHQAQGVGLGLYLCQEIIINKLKGFIDIQNTNIKIQDKFYNGASCNLILPI